MLPFTSLNAVTSAQVGASKDLEGLLATHHMLVSAGGTSASAQVQLEGSLDGTNWESFGSVGVGSGGSGSVRIVDTPLRFIRANATSLSGTSPTVTAAIASM